MAQKKASTTAKQTVKTKAAARKPAAQKVSAAARKAAQKPRGSAPKAPVRAEAPKKTSAAKSKSAAKAAVAKSGKAAATKAPTRTAAKASPAKSSAKKPAAASPKAAASKAGPATTSKKRAVSSAAPKAPIKKAAPAAKNAAKTSTLDIIAAAAAKQRATATPRAVAASVGKGSTKKITAAVGGPKKAAPKAAPKPAKAAAPAAPAAPKKPVSQRHGFKIGEQVVYPAHGVGKIVAIEEQDIAGLSLELFVINFEKEKLTLRVPTGKLDSVQMRKLSDDGLVKKALSILKGRARVKRTMWSRRAQEYVAKINSGDLISIAEVVRDLYRSEAQPEQSYSERQLYEDALDRMAREVAAVEKLDDRGAVQRITEILSKSAKTRRAAEAEADAESNGDDDATKAA